MHFAPLLQLELEAEEMHLDAKRGCTTTKKCVTRELVDAADAAKDGTMPPEHVHWKKVLDFFCQMRNRA